MTALSCRSCASVLSTGQYASCAVEGTCLTCCSDFVTHCSPVPDADAQQAEQQAELERVQAEAATTVEAPTEAWSSLPWGAGEGDGW